MSKKHGFRIEDNIETGFKGVVDLLMFLAMVVIAVLDFLNVDVTGALGFFALYVFFLIFRMGFFKNALNAYVTDNDYRKLLKLPENDYYE